ncbi:phosphate starvation-inducible protein PhoH [Cohnella fermenti]|uniref:Phosphate starvation-inducible protein PhoH n=1 Tax=Cohnella fermenti TaxID=2565925 RepID=A0A4S4BLU1_9BACL|nr:phosphate starvation-inducible protein PhoH [Cohnella fermenti]THF75758.1 phosphate starvation-inducible protein PhoH [Cohnella fermenti]
MEKHRIAVLDVKVGVMGEVGGSSGYTYIDMYDLPNIPLEPYACLVIHGSSDQEFLLKHKDVVANFLNQGKVVLFGGQLFRPWLPGGSSFVPRTIRSHLDYHIAVAKAHPIFADVDPIELTYKKGVAGFFARGHHPVPAGAEVLLTLPDGEPTLYIDRSSTKGTLMVSSGYNLLGYRDGNTTRSIGERVEAWIAQEYNLLQQGVHIQ